MPPAAISTHTSDELWGLWVGVYISALCDSIKSNIACINTIRKTLLILTHSVCFIVLYYIEFDINNESSIYFIASLWSLLAAYEMYYLLYMTEEKALCVYFCLIFRGPCVWPVHHRTHHRYYPVGHRIPRPLLPHCVQAQLHQPQHFLWWKLFHCGWHLLWAWSNSNQRWQVRE